MKERSILFQGWKVNKILNWDWAKSNMQTRRVLKPQPPDDYAHLIGPEMYAPTVVDKWGDEQPGDEVFGVYTEDGEWGLKCLYGKPGDLLWAKETHRWADQLIDGYERDEPYYVQYRADGLVMMVNQKSDGMEIMGERYGESWSTSSRFGKWRPSIFMPRWASRIDLEIVDIRVEQVQNISPQEALMEGIDPPLTPNKQSFDEFALWRFKEIWDSINAKRGYGWYKNPWVWVVEYKLAK